MERNEVADDPLVLGNSHGRLTLAFRDGTSASAESGTAIAFGQDAKAEVTGWLGAALAVGAGGRAEGPIALGIRDSGVSAVGQALAIVLGSHSVATAEEIAFAWNIKGEAHADKIALATGKSGLADGMIAISLGQEGRAVARPGGTIVLGLYEEQDGHWEFPHGADQTWIEGDTTLTGLRVAPVGSNSIRPGYIYSLNRQGEFEEVEPAEQASSSVE